MFDAVSSHGKWWLDKKFKGLLIKADAGSPPTVYIYTAFSRGNGTYDIAPNKYGPRKKLIT